MTTTGLVITGLIVLVMAVLVLLGPRLTARRSPPADDPAPSPPPDFS
ncbi:hypothetical protein [Streptomyces sp. NRRL S-241]|nr:hypothetical protein [Streptomyces sp. NRRL S-241]